MFPTCIPRSISLLPWDVSPMCTEIFLIYTLRYMYPNLSQLILKGNEIEPSRMANNKRKKRLDPFFYWRATNLTIFNDINQTISRKNMNFVDTFFTLEVWKIREQNLFTLLFTTWNPTVGCFSPVLWDYILSSEWPADNLGRELPSCPT